MLACSVTSLYKGAIKTEDKQMTEFYVIEKAFTPEGEQIDSYDIATFSTWAEAEAYAEKLAAAQDACPPNADEPRCIWFTEQA